MDKNEPNYILFAIPFFFLLIGIELLVGYLQHKKLYRFNDAVTNLNIGIGNQAFGLVFKFLIFGMYTLIQGKWALFHIAPSVGSFLLCLLLFDFIFYWAHRLGHEVNFFWGAHVVHHSSEEYNLSVALRQPWFHNLIAFFMFLPIPFLGFEPMTFLLAGSVNTLYQFWIHTKVIGKVWSPFEFIFNTPSHHRVHHGVEPKYIDKNHGGLLIIWDRLFGTFMEEQEEPSYGITTQLKSWNPTWANVHYYVDMVKLAKQMPSWKDRIKLVFARPGWRPDYLGGMQYPPEVDKSTRKLFGTNTSLGLNLYVLAQFLFITVGLVAYMSNFDQLSGYYQMLFLSAIVISTMICGAIFEGKKWVIIAEYVRLPLVILILNAHYYSYYINWFNVMLTASLIGFGLFTIWFTISWIRARNSFSPAYL